MSNTFFRVANIFPGGPLHPTPYSVTGLMVLIY